MESATPSITPPTPGRARGAFLGIPKLYGAVNQGTGLGQRSREK